MCKDVKNTPISRDDEYPKFLQDIKTQFTAMTAQHKTLFTTDAEELFEVFLSGLPKAARPHYQCHSCRSFVNRFGGLVAITEKGATVPAIWDFIPPTFFKKSVKALATAVKMAKVTGVFIPSVSVLGSPVTGEWEHISVPAPKSEIRLIWGKTAGQMMAEKREEAKMLENALNEFSLEDCKKAYELIRSESLYRGSQYKTHIEWLIELKETLARSKTEESRKNLIWVTVGKTNNNFCHVKGGMLGVLLEEISSGADIAIVIGRFNEKTDPGQYMRAQAAPTRGAIQQAEKLVAQLGIADSLVRRYATIDEIPEFIWRKRQAKATPTKEGVFGHLEPKQVAPMSDGIALMGKTMTWEKFKRTVLPDATEIEVLTNNPGRFMALVTANDPTAPNILKWDNPFSWYYHGGADGEIKRRVEAAGGQYENNEVRCSLIWGSYTDLDLHCVTPDGGHIYFRDKQRGRGWLDVDANGGGASTIEPVENIRWQNDAPRGEYRFYVHNYCNRDGGRDIPYTVELEVGGKKYTHHGVAGRTNYQRDAFVFHYDGRTARLRGTVDNYCTETAWNIPATQQHVKVTGIVASPNTWGKDDAQGQHIFFLLDGCHDTTEGRGRGFFTEMLKPELREARKTLEAYCAGATILGAENATACGLGYNQESDWDLVMHVRTGRSKQLIKIDRWD